MGKGNVTQVKEFILLGFSYRPHVKIVLFVFFLIIYMVNLSANSLFITVTVVNSRLRSPMYIFLCNLSCLDFWYSSTCALTLLAGLLVQRITIAFWECMTQMYVGLAFAQSECFLLAVMAWDRYVAICRPLNYHQTMNTRVAMKLAVSAWACGFIFSLSSVIIISAVNFCGRNIIDHTICEAEPMSRLICMDVKLLDSMTAILALVSLVGPLSFILLTYAWIICTILRMPSADSRKRTFATCGSHLMVVSLFYGTIMVVYMGPKSANSPEKNKFMSILYVIVVPALNPLIYTMRNKEVKGTLTKLCNSNTRSQKSRPTIS